MSPCLFLKSVGFHVCKRTVTNSGDKTSIAEAKNKPNPFIQNN